MKNATPVMPPVSSALLKVFTAYSRRYVRRRFHAIRIGKDGMPPGEPARPLVIYLNHASWWDPLVCLLLAREFFPGRASFAPIEAAMLERYGFFKRLGFFGVEHGLQRGALTFLRTARTILTSPNNALWLTPQGRFMDVRERPLKLEAGLGALAIREPEAAFVPLAIEYSFWTEPRPEILVSFGQPIIPCNRGAHDMKGWTGVFTDALESTQDKLAARSCQRDAGGWTTLDRGRSGVGGFYDVWRRLKAAARGEKFIPDHMEAMR